METVTELKWTKVVY